MTRPKVEVNQQELNALIDGLIDDAGIGTEAEANEIGEEMVREVERLVRGLYSTPENRKVNTTRLENSFTYEVTGDKRNGFNVALTIRSGVASGKIGALNYGRDGSSKSYTIRPRNAPRALEFKGSGVDTSYAYTRKDGSPGKYGSRVFRPYANRKSAGAMSGTGFLEEARENVLRRRGYDV